MLISMSVDPAAIIEQNLQSPASASVDGRTATQHSLADQIAAAKFLATQSTLEETDGDGWSAVGRRVGKPTGAV